MTTSGRALLLALLVLATSACGGDDHQRLLRGWERDGPGDFIQVDAGPAHCDFDDALILNVGWPIQSSNTGGPGLSFVRDPEGVMANYTVDAFDADVDLPEGAVATGYENDAGVELWLENDYSSAYLVDGDTVEAWPALQGWVCA